MKKNSILIFFLMVAGAGCAAMLTANGREWNSWNAATPEDTLDLKPIGVNDRVAIDSTFFEEYDSLEQARLDSLDSSPRVYNLHLMARAYKDHVTLRWAPSGYVPWRYLQDDGFLLERIHIDEEEGVVFDTLGTFKPLTVEQFKARFAENDTLAGAAVSLLYSRNVRTTGQTDAYPGSMKSIVELHEEQENRAGFTMLLADLRPDLADAMGLRYEDHTVKPGIEYSYFLHPLTPDTLLRIHSAYVINIMAGKSEQEKFNPVITDSISRPQSLKLLWPIMPYTAYTIERRQKGKREWTLLTDQPYIPFTNAEVGDSTMHFYVDNPDPGTYEYRITAIDAFGEKTEPSAPHEVTMPDLIPPQAPYIKRIWLNRRDETHGTADVVFGYLKGQQPDEKTIGYHIFYNNPTLFGDSLVQMTTTMIAPADTVGTITIDNLPTGFLTIAAYDKNGNQGLSAPQMIRIDDLVPPHAPTNLRAHVAPDGLLVLRWSPVPDRDLMNYEVYMANDTTHTFMNIAPPELRDTAFVDSLALGLNQKYIYYKLKAVDWSGNQSEFSELLQVLRPNFAPPSVCRIDSVAMTDDNIYMRWIQSAEVDIERSRLFRRLEDSLQWTLVGVYDADSVRREGNLIRVTDSPKPNMKQCYVYCMETQNASGVSSGMSLPQTFLFTGPRIVEVKLSLAGTFHKAQSTEASPTKQSTEASPTKQSTEASPTKSNVTHLAWDCGTVPDYGPYYFCIYRKGPDDSDFKFLLSAKSTDREFQDYLLRPGQTAQYYITLRYDDGRRSHPSNTVTVTAPTKD